MQTNDILVNALGGLVNIRLDFSAESFESERYDQLRSAWRDAIADSGIPSLPGQPLTEILWAFPSDDEFPRSAAELSTHATLAAIEAQRGNLLMLHASGVADPSGRVLAFIGPSGRGKTTLARNLGTALGYVSDETIAIGSDGTVYPYRKPLSVIRHGQEYKDQLAPSSLGLLDLSANSLSLGGLFLVWRDPELVGEAQVLPMGICEAIAEIVPEASYLAELDQPLQRIARHIDRCGSIRRVVYRDADQVLPMVQGLFTRLEPDEWEAVLPQPGVKGVHVRNSTISFGPAPILDAIESGGFTAILDLNRMVHFLDGVGPLIWKALCQGIDFEALVSEVANQHGDPPEGSIEDALLYVLETLAGAGVLTRSELVAP